MNAEPVAHTPGPWRYFDPSGERKPDPDHGTYFRIAGARGFSLDGRGFCVTGYVPEADARLMAAAPDLLAALREMVECYGIFGGPIAIIERATAAIAKATMPEPPKEPA